MECAGMAFPSLSLETVSNTCTSSSSICARKVVTPLTSTTMAVTSPSSDSSALTSMGSP
eukprot:CAMPEP_0198715314 /NCGR_PEP_ID=MMETSP1471-20131121/29557_1 /TAXON_ID=41880 /ORGANISM="Pycnococcus provasolii, Strain RCC733" /LENGTH=58 /DNA_ID=CAMNT_0044475731 /DNA_START=147 /DNA_END=323 /DNA_ORIENTATION=-